jgi:hypothetical protein
MEFAEKYTLNLREAPLKLSGSWLPDSHLTLKLLMLFQSANPGR